MNSPPTSERRTPAIYPCLVGGIAGAVMWLGFARFDIHREGWDEPAWFTIGLPCLVMLCCTLGYLVPVRAWRWGVAPMLTQAALAVAGNPTAILLPLGLGLFTFLTVVCVAAAALGGFLRQQLGRPESV